jgi:hypothetical protein
VLQKARNLEENLEADIVHHQMEKMDNEKNERLTLIFIETTERHMQNFKDQLSDLEDKHVHAPDVPHTACGGEDFPPDPSQLSQATFTSSRRHSWSLSRLFSKRFPWCTMSSIPGEKSIFTNQCFYLLPPVVIVFSPPPHEDRKEMFSGFIPPTNKPVAGTAKVQ